MLELLRNLPRRAQFATIKTITKPKLKKGAPNVEKHSTTQVILNSQYTNAINNQLKRESKPLHVVGPRKWGNRIEGTPLVEHNGKYYLETQFVKSLGTQYFDGDTEIDADVVKDFLPQQKYLTDKPVIWRDYALDSIQSIKVNGETYENNL